MFLKRMLVVFCVLCAPYLACSDLMVERRPWGVKPSFDQFGEILRFQQGQEESTRARSWVLTSIRVRGLPADLQNRIASFLPYYVVRKLDQRIAPRSFQKKIPKKNVFPCKFENAILFLNAKGSIIQRVDAKQGIEFRNDYFGTPNTTKIYDWDRTGRYFLLTSNNSRPKKLYIYDWKEDKVEKHEFKDEIGWMRFHPMGKEKQILLAKVESVEGGDRSFRVYMVDLNGKERVEIPVQFNYKGRNLYLQAKIWPIWNDIKTKHDFPYLIHPNVDTHFMLESKNFKSEPLFINLETKTARRLDGVVTIDDDGMILNQLSNGTVHVFNEKGIDVTWPAGGTCDRIKGEDSCLIVRYDSEKDEHDYTVRRDHDAVGNIVREQKLADFSDPRNPDGTKFVYIDDKESVCLVDTRTGYEESLTLPRKFDITNVYFMSNDVLAMECSRPRSLFGQDVYFVHCITLGDLLAQRQTRAEAAGKK